jgi:serine/threonine protein phosphatase PrpC
MPGTSEASPVEEIRFQTPADAARLRVPVRDGDLVVLATDGLFDNVQLSDVLKTAVDAHKAGTLFVFSLYI